MTVVVNEAWGLEKELCCIVQNRINPGNSRFTVMISSRSTVARFCSDVAKKSRYALKTYDLVLVDRENNNDELVLDEDSTKVLGEVVQGSSGSSAKKHFFEIREKEHVEVEMSQPYTIKENEASVFASPSSTASGGYTSNKNAVSFKRRAAISSECIDIQTKTDIDKMNNQNLLNNEESASGGADDTLMISSPPNIHHIHKYRGLVNQAMTCYLNSLIQTLYMTPEFRNTLYRWKFDNNEDETLSIPYQLQHLFLLLQTSDRESAETTGLTRSFGWDSSEAWQQHDIQELCRVMFEALENKFEGTDQADLIKRLYEGRMKDYVQCCECSYESARDDAFLDIPITIRPFASNTSYKSVMEGLNAFVEPETLNDTNQYYCERCAKKCDAKKGLKFTKFPYLLTLQLKRFDFDYSTMRRIKLQDRMHFPMLLDLNSFIETDDDVDESTSDKESSCPSHSSKEAADYRLSPGPCDEEDLSSHDSGQDYDRSPAITGSIPAVDDSHTSSSTDPTSSSASSTSTTTTANNSTNIVVGLSRNVIAPSSGGSGGHISEEDVSSVDEGIDVGGASSTTSTVKSLPATSSSTSGASNVKRQAQSSPASWNNETESLQDGPYIYELFSIMVHSGSAAGGHYYAYIKSFENGLWYSFNDQSVTQVTQMEIEKSFGGSSYSRTSYTSFSSSTNAYMLMYRQLNKSINAEFMQPDDFPPHIKRMIEVEKRKEEQRLMKLEHEKNMCSIRLYCHHPSAGRIGNQGDDFEFHKDTTLEKALKLAHLSLKLDESILPLHNCRLVKYDHIKDAMDRSFDLDTEDCDKSLSELLGGNGSRSPFMIDLLVQTKQDGEEFKRYYANGVTTRIHVADRNSLVFVQFFSARFEESQTVLDVKIHIAEGLGCSPYELILVYEKFGGGFVALKRHENTLKQEGMFRSVRLFVDVMNDAEKRLHSNPFQEFEWENTRLFKILDRISNSIRIKVALPPSPQQQEGDDDIAAAVRKQQVEDGNHDQNNNNEPLPSASMFIEQPTTNNCYGPQLPSYSSVAPNNQQQPSSDTTSTGDHEKSAQRGSGGGIWAQETSADGDDDLLMELERSLWKDPADQDETSSAVATGGRRRTNSCEDNFFTGEDNTGTDVSGGGGVTTSSCASNFPNELQRKLDLFFKEKAYKNMEYENSSMNVSPTSSLRCEADGDSIHSQNCSSLDEVDFQLDSSQSHHHDPDLPSSHPDEDGREVMYRSSDPVSEYFYDTPLGDNELGQALTNDEVNDVIQAVESSSNRHSSNDDDEGHGSYEEGCGGNNMDTFTSMFTSSTNYTQTSNRLVNQSPIIASTHSTSSTATSSCVVGTVTSSRPSSTVVSSSDSYNKALEYAEMSTSPQQRQQKTTTTNTTSLYSLLNKVEAMDETTTSSTSSPSGAMTSQCRDCNNQDDGGSGDAGSSLVKNNQSSSRKTSNMESGEDKQQGDGRKAESSSSSSLPLDGAVVTADCNSGESDEMQQETSSSERERTISQSSCDGWEVSPEVMHKNYHFRLVSTHQRNDDETKTTQTVLDLELDKRMPMIVLRKNLAKMLGRSSRKICLYKICVSKQEVEMTKPLDDLHMVPEHQEYLIKFGRALKKNECRCKIYLLEVNNPEHSKLLFDDYVVEYGKTVQETKEGICAKLAENRMIYTTPDRLRMRKKTWKHPFTIYLPDEVIGKEVHCYGTLDFYVQVLPGPEPKLSRDHHVILCKRWRPSQLSFDDFFELVLDLDAEQARRVSFDCVREKICAKTDLPWDRIIIAKVRTGSFPYTIHPLDAERELEWCYTQTLRQLVPAIDDGAVFFFKDSQEKLKEISESERADMIGSDANSTTGLEALSSMTSDDTTTSGCEPSTSSNICQPRPNNYRREKALKIYTVDTQPKKNTRFAS